MVAVECSKLAEAAQLLVMGKEEKFTSIVSLLPTCHGAKFCKRQKKLPPRLIVFSSQNQIEFVNFYRMYRVNNTFSYDFKSNLQSTGLLYK